MPMEMLRASGDDLRGELLAMGVEIDPTPKARHLLSIYLQANRPNDGCAARSRSDGARILRIA